MINLDTPTYFGLDYKDLNFIHVLKGFGDSIVNNRGELELKLDDTSFERNYRNTTHGTLNAIAQDHGIGELGNSRFAVVAPLLELAKNNELINLNAVDTYFWNKDQKITLNEATLFAPHGETLPNNLEKLNVIRYIPDSENNYANLSEAIIDYMEKQHVPMLKIDNQGWIIDKSLHQYAPEPEQARIFAEEIGYPITYGLNDSSAYSELEKIGYKNYKTSLEFQGLQSKEDFEEGNKLRITNDQVGQTYLAEVESNQVSAVKLIQELPEHHQKFYKDNLLSSLEETKLNIIKSVDEWYAPEVSSEITSDNLISPVPNIETKVSTTPVLNYRTLGSEPKTESPSANEKIFAVINDFIGTGQDENIITKADINAVNSFYNQLNERITKLGISKDVLPLGIDKNLHNHYQSLEGADKVEFQKAYEKMATDAQCQRVLTNLVNLSKILTHDISENIRDYTTKLIDVFPSRDFKLDQDAAMAWEKAKNSFYIKALSDHNLSKDISQNMIFHTVAITPFMTAKKKAWWDLISKESPLDKVDFSHADEHAKLMDKNFNTMSNYLTQELAKPSTLEKNEKAEKERQIQLKRELENKRRSDELQKQIEADQLAIQKRNQEDYERQKQAELEQAQARQHQEQTKDKDGVNAKHIITAVGVVAFMQQYNKKGENDFNSALLNERDRLEKHKALVSSNLIAFKKALQDAGLPRNDIFFDKRENGELPEISYGLKAIIDSSPTVKLTLNNLEDSLAQYTESTLQHSINTNKVVDHLSERLTIPDAHNIRANIDEYKNIHRDFTTGLKNAENDIKKHIDFIDTIHGNKNESLHATIMSIKNFNEKTFVNLEPDFISQYALQKNAQLKNHLNNGFNHS